MKQLFKRTAALLMCALVLFCAAGCSDFEDYDEEDDDYSYEDETDDIDLGEDDGDYSQSSTRSGGSYIAKGDTSDGTFTLMLYICASDLESEGGAATADLDEILYGDISDDVNIVIQTGGTTEWYNSVIDAGKTQRYLAKNDGLQLIDDSLGQLNMTDASTLENFIRFSRESYPAERYALIMWDHGGGSVYGFGSDENYEGDSLTLSEIDYALKSADTAFSFIGFDACLMSSIETIITVSRYADYFIASENIEPGVGWYYTDWISMLSDNPTVDIPSLGKKICADYIEHASSDDPTTHSTLAVYDLALVRENVIPAFDSFLSGCDVKIQSGEFNTLSYNRGRAKEVYDDTEHIDLINYAEAVGTDDGSALCNAIDEAMLTFDKSKSNNRYRGVSVYLPFSDIEEIDTILDINKSVNFCDNYSSFMKRYANALSGGHSSSEHSASYADDSSYDNTAEYEWYDSEYVDDMQECYSHYQINEEELVLTDMGDYYALQMSEDDWDLITDAELCLYGYYDGTLIEYGNDAVGSFDDDGNLIVGFDYTWVALNGNVVPFYTEYTESDDDGFYSMGYVPAVINDEYYDIIIVWDSEDYPDGVVAGARPAGESEALTTPKGLYQIKDGDEITILCYASETEDGELEQMFYGDSFIVDGGLTVSYESVDESGEFEIYYLITDIYNNYYWTESLFG